MPGQAPKHLLALLLYRGVADQTQKSWMRSAGFGLAVLSVINLFSYLDRYIVSALIESLKHSELALTDADLGSLMSGFLVVYTLTAPVFGALGDRRGGGESRGLSLVGDPRDNAERQQGGP